MSFWDSKEAEPIITAIEKLQNRLEPELRAFIREKLDELQGQPDDDDIIVGTAVELALLKTAADWGLLCKEANPEMVLDRAEFADHARKMFTVALHDRSEKRKKGIT